MIILSTDGWSQCLLNMLLTLYPVDMISKIFDAIAALTQWYASILCLLPNVECGRVELVTTDLFSPNR